VLLLVATQTTLFQDLISGFPSLTAPKGYYYGDESDW